MDNATLWWICAGLAVAVELMTGTFYLLMLSVGFAASALAAQAGADLPAEILAGALVGGGAVVALRFFKKSAKPLAAGANPDVNLDVGATVQVEHWGTDGKATVKYRGATWAVSIVAGEQPTSGPHQIVEVVGSCFIVKKR